MPRNVVAACKVEWRIVLHLDLLVPSFRAPMNALVDHGFAMHYRSRLFNPSDRPSLKPHHLCAPADLLASSVDRRDLFV